MAHHRHRDYPWWLLALAWLLTPPHVFTKLAGVCILIALAVSTVVGLVIFPWSLLLH